MALTFLTPDSTVSAGATWAPTGAATLHEAVDDAPGAPDDAATAAGGSQGSWDDMVLGLSPLEGVVEVEQVTMVVRAIAVGGATGQELDFGLRLGGADYLNGSVSPTASYSNFSKTWTTNPATSRPWTKPDLDEALAVVRTQDLTMPTDTLGVTQVYIEVSFLPLGAGLEPARGALSWRLRRYREELPKTAITLRLDLADLELVDNVSVSHFELPPIAPDGDPYGIQPWERHLFMVAEEEIDLNSMTITHQLHDQRPLLCLFWDTAESRISSSQLEDGVARLTTGGAVALARDSRAWFKDPASRLVVEGGINQKPIALDGLQMWFFATNFLAHSSCKEGASSVSALPAMSGSGTFTAEAGPPSPYFDPTVSNHAYLSTKGSPHTTIQVQPVTTTASIPANTEMRLWFIYMDDASGVNADQTRWRYVRNSDGFFWNDSTGAFQAGAIDNVAPLSTVQAEFVSKRIATGGSASTFTLSWVKNSGGTAAFKSRIYHWQLEDNYWPTPPIVTTAATYAREVQTYGVEHLPSVDKPAFNNEFGTFLVECISGFDAADMDAYGGFPALKHLEFDANNRWLLFYNSGTQTLDFLVEVAGATVAASIAWAPVRGTRYRIGARWIGAAGELGETPYTISVFLDGVRGTDAVRAGDPVEADSVLYLGGDGIGNAFNGTIRRIVSVQFPMTDAEIAGFRP